MKLTSLLAGLAALALFSCKNEPAPPALEWRAMKLQEKICTSPSDTNRCCRVEVDLPVAVCAAAPAVAAAINDSLKSDALTTLGVGDGPQPTEVEAAVKAFVASYDDFVKENAEYPGGYDAEVKGKPFFSSSKVASVEVDNYVNSGGAHPNHWTRLRTFDRKTGRQLGAKDLFTDLMAVEKLLVKPFCELKKGDDGSVPKLPDLLFPDVKFGLPQNIAVVKEGVRFYYNPYELTAYAIGDFDITLTWEQLGALAKKEMFID